MGTFLMIKIMKSVGVLLFLVFTLSTAKDALTYNEIDRACKKNDAKSCYSLAQHSRKNDDKKKFYRKSCKLGYAKSCTKMASFFDANPDDKDSFNKRVKYHKLGCKGYAEGCRELADLYSFFNEDKKAVPYYKLACEKGSGYGCRQLAWVYEKGYGVQKNTKKALHYYRQTCLLESSECWFIGEHYVNGTRC